MIQKECVQCKFRKPLNEFVANKNFKDGYRNRCKVCRNKNTQNYRDLNRDSIREKSATWARKRYSTDLNFKIAHILRKRVSKSLRNKKKVGSAIRDLGCTVTELRQWLESQFSPGMSWQNHGKWHVDHKIPLSKFDLTNEVQFKKACNYENLQPLWADDNMRKGNRI